MHSSTSIPPLAPVRTAPTSALLEAAPAGWKGTEGELNGDDGDDGSPNAGPPWNAAVADDDANEARWGRLRAGRRGCCSERRNVDGRMRARAEGGVG